VDRLDDLERNGTMRWRAEDHAWIADPEDVVKALVTEGFHEYRREIAKGGRERAASGGMWQGLDPRTGVVATVIWVAHATVSESHVFIEIDGHPLEGSAWSEIDTAILQVLATRGGRLTPAQIAEHVGMSEGAVQSVVSMLAERGKVRIAAVELVAHDHQPGVRAPRTESHAPGLASD
jgi:Winged helix-turn-helix DNA-binding